VDVLVNYVRTGASVDVFMGFLVFGRFFFSFTSFLFILLFADALTEPFLVGIVRKRGGLSLGLLKN
jgi:hypothetical protein